MNKTKLKTKLSQPEEAELLLSEEFMNTFIISLESAMQSNEKASPEFEPEALDDGPPLEVEPEEFEELDFGTDFDRQYEPDYDDLDVDGDDLSAESWAREIAED